MAKAATAKGGTRPLSRVGDADLVERRRAQIVEAATRLVARQGFAKTVVRDIAEEANISVGLVYEYVRSKEDILFLIYEHWSRVWGEGLEKAIARGKDPLDQLMAAGRASEHDARICRHLATILAGGDLTEPQWVEEQYMLDLERRAFIALCHEPKSIERMWAMLKTGKPLRN